MRSRLLWPVSLQQWSPGLLLSVPVGLALLLTRDTPQISAIVASLAIVLAVPWVIPLTMLGAVLSAPIYMWLHTQGPVPQVLDWLGAVVLASAVGGSHINAALLTAWQRAKRSDIAESGLRDFLLKKRHGQGHRFH